MFRFIVALMVAGIGGLFGFVFGSALTGGDWLPSLALGGVGFLVGFVAWEGLMSIGGRGSHPDST